MKEVIVENFMDWVADGNWKYMYFLMAVLLATGTTLCYNMVMRKRRTGDQRWRWTDEVGYWCMKLALVALMLAVYGQKFNSHP